MRGLALLIAVGISALVVGVVLAPSGSAQAPPGGRTLTFFQSDQPSMFKFVDTAPRSPSSNLESRRFRFSVGDSILFRTPLFDRRGGTRVGTLHAQATVIKGTRPRNVELLLNAVYRLRDGQIVAAGHQGLEQMNVPLPIVGGAGAYEGARGHQVSRDVQGGWEDTVHLLP